MSSLPDLLDIIVSEPILKEDVVIIKVTINYKGNTFEWLGVESYDRGSSTGSKLDYAIHKAQHDAMNGAKKLVSSNISY